ncbi:hypothetical protein RchiOBHm_Chr2g0124541 [Rosa chinensis]|uniref:Uncharacterized protein n=1 Tax=Rosa chinensis TaxID=74649 RepID=A0A2P6RTA8_ROSCH|nr:hypothetical protein RchiOBHm_Chr2g0124541 [Rosa chinensis]
MSLYLICFIRQIPHFWWHLYCLSTQGGSSRTTVAYVSAGG